MRKNAAQQVELECLFCHSKFKRLARYYRMRVKRGDTRFHCSRHCSASNNPGLTKQQEYHRQHPEELAVHLSLIRKLREREGGRYQDEFSCMRYFLQNIKRLRNRATHKNFEVDISLMDLLTQWQKQQGICPYTGLHMILSPVSWKRSKTPVSASLDRIDSRRGYTKDNIEFVCYSVNLAKNDFTKNQMIEFFSQLRGLNPIQHENISLN